MAEIDFVSSHTPWTPLPHEVPWAAVGNGSIYDSQPAQGLSPGIVWQSPHHVQQLYGQSVQYSISTLFSFPSPLTNNPNLVLIVLGDHQPAAEVSGAGANHNVPISIISRPKSLAESRPGAGNRACSPHLRRPCGGWMPSATDSSPRTVNDQPTGRMLKKDALDNQRFGIRRKPSLRPDKNRGRATSTGERGAEGGSLPTGFTSRDDHPDDRQGRPDALGDGAKGLLEEPDGLEHGRKRSDRRDADVPRHQHRDWAMPATVRALNDAVPLPLITTLKEPLSAVTVWSWLSIFVIVTVVPAGTEEDCIRTSVAVSYSAPSTAAVVSAGSGAGPGGEERSPET